jgi:hypothetical protein
MQRAGGLEVDVRVSDVLSWLVEPEPSEAPR